MTYDAVPSFDISMGEDSAPVAEVPVSRSIEVARELLDLQAKKAELESSISDKETEVKQLNLEMIAIRTTLEAQLTLLGNKKWEIEQELHDTRREISKLTQEILRVEKLLQLELAKERATAEFAANSVHFDDITAGLPWREWAFSYQIEGGQILANNKKAILGDKMGLGKTLTSLITLDMLEAQKVIIICPADVISGFRSEILRWAPHRNIIEMYKMTKAVRDTTFGLLAFLKEFVILINYEVWRKDDSFIDKLVELRADTVILDEAHTIKETDSAAFLGCKRLIMGANVCPRCGAADKHVQIPGTMSFHWLCTNCEWDSAKDLKYDAEQRFSVKNVYPMTGTPILNRPQELFPLLHLILPGVFMTMNDYLATFCQRNLVTGYWEFRPGALDRLSVLLAGRYVARTKEMVGLELPPQTITVHEIEIDPETYPDQWRVMQQLKQHAQIVLTSGKSLSAIATIALITRQRQANVYPAGIQVKDNDKESPSYGQILFSVGDEVRESIKIDKALELIKDFTADGNIELGERVALFSQFKGPLQELSHKLDALGISNCVLDGDTSEQKREWIKRDFDRKYTDNKEAQWQVVLCNFKVGGIGLNLTGATQTIILDEEWNPGKNEQAYDRTNRIGQIEATGIHIIRIKNTIDTWMAKLVEFKKGVVSGFEASTQDLSRLLLNALENGEI